MLSAEYSKYIDLLEKTLFFFPRENKVCIISLCAYMQWMWPKINHGNTQSEIEVAQSVQHIKENVTCITHPKNYNLVNARIPSHGYFFLQSILLFFSQSH